MAKLEAVVTATEKLLSPAAPKVLALAGSQEPRIEALREAIAVDPMLTVRVIAYANHSYYSRQVPVASVRRALVRLGWKASRDVMIRLLVEGAAQRLPRGTGAPVWEHATLVAALTRAIAKAGGALDAELAYTAGLTHSLGILGLLALHREEYAAAVHAAKTGVHLAAVEREQYGYDHALVGSGLLERLAVPDPLVHAVRWQYHGRLASKDWHGNPGLLAAGTLQLAHRMLARADGSLPPVEQVVAWPIAAKLGIDLAAAERVAERYLADTEGQQAA